MVALPCASRSTSSSFFGTPASAAARLTAVVVFPTPPFWLAMAMMRAIGLRGSGGWQVIWNRPRGPQAGRSLCPSAAAAKVWPWWRRGSVRAVHGDQVALGVQARHAQAHDV